MPNSPPALEQIREKLKRAKEHIDELAIEIEAYLDRAPNRTLVDYNPAMAEAFRRFFETSPIPLRISVLTGEAVHQLRSSLDHLLCALIIRDGGTPIVTSQFPIFRYKPADKDSIKRWNAQIQGIKRVRVIALLKRSQPFQRRSRSHNHWMAILKELNNRDKHKSLVLHVVTADPRVSISTRTGNVSGSFWGPDDGTHPTSDFIDISGKPVHILKVQRHLVARITLDKWGNSGMVVDVVDAFRRAFLPGVTSVVNAFEPLLTSRMR